MSIHRHVISREQEAQLDRYVAGSYRACGTTDEMFCREVTQNLDFDVTYGHLQASLARLGMESNAAVRRKALAAQREAVATAVAAAARPPVPKGIVERPLALPAGVTLSNSKPTDNRVHELEALIKYANGLVTNCLKLSADLTHITQLISDQERRMRRVEQDVATVLDSMTKPTPATKEVLQ